jgi:cell division protein FtsL
MKINKFLLVTSVIATAMAVSEYLIRKDAEYYVTAADIAIKNRITEIEEARGRIVDLEDEISDLKKYYSSRKHTARVRH